MINQMQITIIDKINTIRSIQVCIKIIISLTYFVQPEKQSKYSKMINKLKNYDSSKIWQTMDDQIKKTQKYIKLVQKQMEKLVRKANERQKNKISRLPPITQRQSKLNVQKLSSPMVEKQGQNNIQKKLNNDSIQQTNREQRQYASANNSARKHNKSMNKMNRLLNKIKQDNIKVKVRELSNLQLKQLNIKNSNEHIIHSTRANQYQYANGIKSGRKSNPEIHFRSLSNSKICSPAHKNMQQKQEEGGQESSKVQQIIKLINKMNKTPKQHKNRSTDQTYFRKYERKNLIQRKMNSQKELRMSSIEDGLVKTSRRFASAITPVKTKIVRIETQINKSKQQQQDRSSKRQFRSLDYRYSVILDKIRENLSGIKCKKKKQKVKAKHAQSQQKLQNNVQDCSPWEQNGFSFELGDHISKEEHNFP